MNSDLRQFATQYLSVVVATLMAVSLVAFLAIPYSLRGHPGDLRVSQSLVQTAVQTPAAPTRLAPTLSPEV